MKILVTGAAGFIGSHTCERFLSLGHQVIGIDCFTPYYSRALKEKNAADIKNKGCEIVELDLASGSFENSGSNPSPDPIGTTTPNSSLENIVSNVDIIFHLAGQPGISSKTPFEDYVKNNITATKNLLDACKSNTNLKLFVNIATSSVYGLYASSDEKVAPEPASDYGVTKLAGEQLVLAENRDKKFPACSLRIYSVIGPRERPEKLWHKLIKSTLEPNAEPTPIYDGSENHKRSYTYVGDIVDAFEHILNAPDKCLGQIFNVGNSEIITTREGMWMLEEIIQKPLNIVNVPNKRAGDQLETGAVIDKIKDTLGWYPKTSVKEALGETVKWYKSEILGKVVY